MIDRFLSQEYKMANVQLGHTTKQRKALNSLVPVMMIYQIFGNQLKLNLNVSRTGLKSLEMKVDGITHAIDNLECYSYQYNLKIVGIPELKARKSSLENSYVFSCLKKWVLPVFH